MKCCGSREKLYRRVRNLGLPNMGIGPVGDFCGAFGRKQLVVGVKMAAAE